MEYKEVELKKGSNKYYFCQPKRCYCDKDEAGKEYKQRLLAPGTICRWCATVTEKIAERENVMEVQIVGKRPERYRNKEGKVKTCKLKNEKLFY